jgi:succinate dehydrogenase / fumarate reductase membrane anchor subunit
MTKDVESIQTWGKKVRYLGAAHSGTGAARALHLTSVALMPLTIAFVWILARASHADYAGARAELGATCPAILMLLFVGASIWHMKIGMQAIIDDYIHSRHAKEAALIANTLFSAVLGLCCVFALLKISFTQG